MIQEILFSTPHHVIGYLQNGDRPLLLALLKRCKEDDLSPADDRPLFGIWDLNNHLIGVLDAAQNEHLPEEWFIDLLLIDPAQRGQDIEIQIYLAFEAWILRCGAQTVTLRGNATASPFWEQLEFTSRIPDGEESPVMQRILTPEILKTIFKRRSIRHYADRPVEKEVLVKLLQAGMSAPTACNSQPWEFVVITEKAQLDRLREKLMFARYNGPAAIVVCGNVDIAHNAVAQRYWIQDCCAATENILIAATGMGLGSVWIGLYPLPSTMKPVHQVLNIPENVTPLCLLYVGYPAEEKRPRTQYDAYRVHWEEYEPRKKRAKIKNAKHLE